MTGPLHLFLSWVALSGCYTQNRYQGDQAEALCQLYESCGYLESVGVTTYKECVNVMSGGTLQCDGYDAGAASDCVDGINTLTCERHAEGYWPSACNEVCESTVQVD